ncbi:Phosphoglycerol transferase and related proteins, alkaline phosphatase superfamily [Pluralibacter gergoviae]|nr:Phosphoglycerol transferase and related proteins, alkaline phosphatase superfamily [Pluralibacter gergoviae]
MMQLLADNRYQFAILGSAALDHPPFDRTVFSGIENLRVTTPGKDQATRDRRITDDFKQFLDSRDAGRPFFGFLFYDAVHGYDLHPDTMQTPFRPYWERVDHIMLDNAFDPTPYHNRYRNVLLYDDALIGEVLAKLKQQGLDDNTIVVVTTDHGEEFNDNHQNYWGARQQLQPDAGTCPAVYPLAGHGSARY